MIKIKLVRLGKKNQPFYRIVVIQSRAKLNGRYLDLLGFYNPQKKPFELKINREKYLSWIKKGAQPSERLASLLKKTE